MEDAATQHLAQEPVAGQAQHTEDENAARDSSYATLANMISATKGQDGAPDQGPTGEEPDAKRHKVEDPNSMAGYHLDQNGGLVIEGMDPNAAAAVVAAAGGENLTAEQLAALQQQMGPMMMNPEMMAAAQASMGMQQTITGPDGQPMNVMVDPNQQQYFDLSAFGVNPEWMQTLPPDQMAALMANPQLAGQFFGGYGMGQYDLSQWGFEEQDMPMAQELWRMLMDPAYSQEKLGMDEPDMAEETLAKLEEMLGQPQSAVRDKLHILKSFKDQGFDLSMQLDPNAAAAVNSFMFSGGAGMQNNSNKSRAERKNWSDEENREMARIVSDAAYRKEQGFEEGEDDVSWERLAHHFNCSVQTAKRKYRHLQEQAAQFGGVIPEKTKRQHFRKSVPYRWMIVSAMSKMAHMQYEATAPQIFEMIENDPELQDQLDMRIMPGTKHVPRWRIQVRKVLSADHIFINTGVKAKHETVWRLDQSALTMQEANADRQRQRAGLNQMNMQQQAEANAAAAAAAAADPNGANAALQIPDLSLLTQMGHYMLPDGTMVPAILPPGAQNPDGSLTVEYLQQLQQLQADPAAALAAWSTPEGQAMMAAAGVVFPEGMDPAVAAAVAQGMDPNYVIQVAATDGSTMPPPPLESTGGVEGQEVTGNGESDVKAEPDQ